MLKKRLENTIIKNNLLSAGDLVITGVSGGPDSVALLCLLCQAEPSVSPVAVYVDHGLRKEEAVAEKKLVKNLARSLDIPFETVKIDVNNHVKTHKTSVEEAGRLLRYEALDTYYQQYNATAIAVGHTADDQAEELLLRLIRGTGLKGLSGMDIRNNNIIRPLLAEKKDALLNYLHKNGIPYCHDSTNSEHTFLRNRVRLQLLPLLENNFNPSIRTNIVQTTDILKQDEDFLTKFTQDKYKNCVKAVQDGRENSTYSKSLSLNSESFLSYHRSIRRRIVEKICWKLEVRPSYRQIERVEHLAEQGKNGSELHLAKGLRVFKHPSTLNFTRPFPADILPVGRAIRGCSYHQPLVPVQIEKSGKYNVEELGKTFSLHSVDSPDQCTPDTLFLDGDKIHFPLVLRPHQPGERFQPSGMQGRKKISRFLSDLKIPRTKRHLHPVLASEEDIIAVTGLRVEQRYCINEETKEVLALYWTSLV